MAVKKSYLFNKIIQSIEKEMVLQSNEEMSKQLKKEKFLQIYFPNLNKKHKDLFYK